jgi:glycosyltransferase involved in cell wall biosynthesis
VRIALVVHKFPPASVGGTEIYAVNLAREFSKCGHEVSVFYRDDSGRHGGALWEDRCGFRAYRVSRGLSGTSVQPLAGFLDTFLNPDVERAFRFFLDEARPDVVHFQHLMSLSYRMIAMVTRRGLPALLTLHDYWFLCANSQLIWPDGQVCSGKAMGFRCARCAMARADSPLMKPLAPAIALALQVRDALVLGAALRANCILAPSHFLMQRYASTGFPSERLMYMENGIDTARIQRYRRQASPDGRLRVAYLGSLAWQKGVHIVAEAFQGIPAEKAVLRIYGDPMVFPDYAARLRQVADPTNTSFEGKVPNNEVGRVLAATDVVVVPSLWYENSPVVIQEAFAAGVPVLASAAGALNEAVRNGETGALVPRGDVLACRLALQRLVNEPNQIERWRANVRPPLPLGEHVHRLESLYRASLRTTDVS